MSSRSHERRTERANAEEVAEIEQQLWEFARHIDPPAVPEARLRPGAFLWRIHRAWHSLGRGTGGLASRSFRALRDELLNRDPPVRNLQPKLYGNTALSQAEAEQLIDVMLESWHLEREPNGKWRSRPLTYPEEASKSARKQDLEAIRENLLHTIFKLDESLLLEEPVGVAPEVFMEERGRTSLGLIMPTKGEVVANFSPANAYGGFSSLIERFFSSSIGTDDTNETPLLIWLLRLPSIRDTFEFHLEFHALSIYSAALTNWFFRLSRQRREDSARAKRLWNLVVEHSSFVVQGLPEWSLGRSAMLADKVKNIELDEDLADIDTETFLPRALPGYFSQLPHIRKHQDSHYGLTVSVERSLDGTQTEGGRIHYWLFPERPKIDVAETAETTGLPILDAKESPGRDFDKAYRAVYEAARYRLGLSNSSRAQTSYATLRANNWQVLPIHDLQSSLLTREALVDRR